MIPFTLPAALEADTPAEVRGGGRDDVRLLVSYTGTDRIVHTRFPRFPAFLCPGDVLVVNTSATINAALGAMRPDGERIALHFSQRMPDDRWVVEIRRGTGPLRDAAPGERLALAGGGTATLDAPYGTRRLWLASLDLGGDVLAYLDRHAAPIRYGYVRDAWPLPYYQTVFAREPGSAEMPSAGRAFTEAMVAALRAGGVEVAPILLHTGVASLEDHEPPYPEYFRVGDAAARAVNEGRRRGGRIIAVGTTAVRALESVAAADGSVTSGEGWTDLVISPERGVRVVDGLLTGFHEPRASHLAMLEALAGGRHVELAYRAALGQRYHWHEFGDLHLIMPGTSTRGDGCIVQSAWLGHSQSCAWASSPAVAAPPRALHRRLPRRHLLPRPAG
jgi:S-adenosylmethionine:tRNA ribosyltransferase-isomerase